MDLSTASDAITPTIDTPPVPGEDTLSVTKRRPIPRKGHTKSKAGCLVCKKRKVKCDETLPCCGECARLSLACRYSRPAAAAREEAALTVRRPLQEEDSKFSIMDLKSFHNFLFTAHPSLPVNGSHVWQKVGQMSHNVNRTLPLGLNSRLTSVVRISRSFNDCPRGVAFGDMR